MNAQDLDTLTAERPADAELQAAVSPAHEPLSGAELERVLEALLLASDEPLSLQRLNEILDNNSPGKAALQAALNSLAQACATRSVELKEVASGYRYQVRADMAYWIS